MAASDVIGSATAAGLMAFCDYMIDRHLAPASAINPWKSAAKSVFTRVEKSADFDALDVQSLDMDEYLQRFVMVSRGDYKPDSLNAYSNRFRKAIEAYRGYLADPVGWRPKLRASSSRRSSELASNDRSTRDETINVQMAPVPASPVVPAAPAAAASGLINYPFPLRNGQMAHLHLPSPLEMEDADRLTQFVRALVFERQAQLPSGERDGE